MIYISQLVRMLALPAAMAAFIFAAQLAGGLTMREETQAGAAASTMPCAPGMAAAEALAKACAAPLG